MARDDLAERLRAGGILAPRMVIEEAKRAGLRLDYACAMLQKESAGGKNVFGHDPTIFVGAGTVTKAKYLDYKRKRVASGNDLMQGVGPTQLTYWTLQDRADAQGGCWKPRINMRVGFKHLADHIRTYGEADGARRYNGSGDAAVAYSKDLLAKAAKWRAVLDGAPPPVAVATGPQPLKAGARGVEVVRLTRRLSRLRSKAGTPYLDKPRKTLDAAAEGALKTFQAEHRLVADGVFGPLSQRKLNRALRLQAKRAKEKKQPQPTAPTPAAARPAKRGRTLKTLVEAVHEADAETGEAWDALVAHAVKRRRLLARATAKVAARPPEAATVIAEGFAAVTQALQKIDGTLDGIAEDLETQAEARVATVAAPAPVATGGGGGGEPPVETADGLTVTQTPPPEPPPNEGPAPPSPAAAAPAAEPRRRELVDLSDEELLDRIARLDRALDRSRAVLIRRYIEVEKDLARLAPERKEKTSTKVKPKPTPTPTPEPVRKERERFTREQVRELQTALNAFSGKHLVGMGPLIVDGVMGPATKKRIRLAKHYLGYTGTARKTIAVDDELLARLRHPRSARHSSPRMLSRALRRRRKQRKAAKLSRAPRAGVDSFDGEPVAAWMKPYLDWAREHGWKGTLNSGWRDPAHSERLCFDICGAPKCSGRCAGRSSNHVGNVKPAGSIDVSDPATFGALMKKCPYEPKLFNALGARDPWHFSASGR